jgi:uncharacterized membrane protein
MRSLIAYLRTDTLTWLSRTLSLVGLGISAYLCFTYLQHTSPLCLVGGNGCTTVEWSRYARPYGFPLPIFGLIGYTMLFTSACLKGQRARTAGVVLAFVAIAASACLTYLELEVIHAVCIWCVSSATCATLHVFVNSARFVRGEPVRADPVPEPPQRLVTG